MQATCEPETKKLTKEEQLILIETKYKEIPGLQRIIKPLWHNYFRVNYFNQPTETFPRSYFIEVKNDGTIQVM